jgi:hypothetical protein
MIRIMPQLAAATFAGRALGALRHPWRTFMPNSTRFFGLLLGLAMLAPLCAGIAQAEPPTQATLRDVPLPVPGQMGPDVLLPGAGALTAPPPNPQVGDSWIWWLWVHVPMPPHFEQRHCTVRGKSDHAYVVVEDTEWNVTIDQAEVDQILERWENSSIGPYPDEGIYQIDSTAFGTPPDELDNDPRIYLVWFNFEIASDGFFFYFDEYPEGAFPGYHSNECEALYLNTTSQGGPGGDYMISVTAHELEHLIQWKYDDDEDSWVDEGNAELAMWLYGRPDVISGFNSTPDNSLTAWGGNWVDYIQTYLWSLYFHERYGGPPATYAVVHQPANSIAGYDAVLNQFGYPEDFDDAFADWTVANFLDDTTIGDGRYGYVGATLPAFNVAGTYSSYPVSNISRTVNYWAADYYRFQSFTGFESLRLSFDGSDNNRFAVWGLTKHASAPTEVWRMTIDLASQTGNLDIPGLTDPADQVIMVVAGISSTGTTSYVFSANESPAAVPEVAWDPLAEPLRIQASPNPARATVALRLQWNVASAGTDAADARVAIFDATGRFVRALRSPASSAGETTLLWDGRGTDGKPAAPGIYYARGQVGSLSAESRILRMP